MKLQIKIHSIVDVITNSSTVIYTQANESTIEGVKEIANTLLKIGNANLTADDLFTFELVDPDIKPYREYEIRVEFSSQIKDWSFLSSARKDEMVEEKYNEYLAMDEKPEWWERNSYDDYYDIDLVVKAKDENNEKVASILSDLTGLFDQDAMRNG